MIAVRLMGGLGNQLFQYAAGRSLAEHYNTALVIDLSFLRKKVDSEKFTHRDFALGHFNIHARVSDDFAEEYLHQSNASLGAKLKRLLNRYYEHYDYSMLYNPAFFKTGKNAILEGYFQCEDYFKEIREFLGRELTPCKNIVTVEETGKLRQPATVGVHIRRGDFSNEKIGALHGTCSISYYEEAFAFMRRSLKDPVFFMFSDDMKWVKEQFGTKDDIVYVENNGADAFLKDFEMLRSCSHQVIANSTFSWWAAWLNPNPSKIVVAPEQWFANGDLQHNIIPASWKKI